MNHKEQIIQNVALSAHALNQMNIELFKKLWAPEATWEISAPLNFKFKGKREEIAGAFEMGMRKVWQSYFQLVQGTIVELTSERTATAKTYIIEQGVKLDGQGQFLVGMYDDQLELSKEGWLFTSRKFLYLYHEQKKLEGTSSPIGTFIK